jgi:hypothetical protein
MTLIPILQSTLSDLQREVAAARLPAMRPVAPGSWLTVDDAYAGQLAEKARLIAARRDWVIDVLPEAEDAVAELMSVVMADIASRPDFRMEAGLIVCPDGRRVDPDAADPMLTLSQLVQEDLCILQRQGDEHVLTAALLCFPASWTLAEKIGRPLMRIHKPVPAYDDGIATRVQRMFDGVQPGRPMWRANYLRYDDFSLFWPRREADPKRVHRPDSLYERSERQTVLRLPGTGAVLFAIHTTMVKALD